MERRKEEQMWQKWLARWQWQDIGPFSQYYQRTPKVGRRGGKRRTAEEILADAKRIREAIERKQQPDQQ